MARGHNRRMNKTTRWRRFAALPALQTFAFPVFFAHSSQKIPPCSCLRTQQTASGLRQMSANARASSAFASAWLAVLFIHSHLQTYGGQFLDLERHEEEKTQGRTPLSEDHTCIGGHSGSRDPDITARAFKRAFKLSNAYLFNTFDRFSSKSLSILTSNTTDILYNVSIEHPIAPFLYSNLLIKS